MVPLLQITDLDKSFFATHAVDHASFRVDAGEIVSLLGENGAGKSTVIKMLAGVDKPDGGTMTLAGADLTRPEVRKNVSFVHQALGLIEWMTVAENIAQVLGYPRRGGLLSHSAMRRQAREVLEMVGGGIDPDARIFDLARTERSLLAIARALVARPKLLVLDEPTASLPAQDVERLFAVLRNLRDDGVGMIYVSHRLDEVYQISSRTVIMRNGAVVADRPVVDLSHRELVDLIVGHAMVNPTFDPPGDGVRLRLNGVRSGDIGPVHLDLHRGEVVALCGLRGAGHAQIGRVIAGAAPLTGGTIELDGAAITPRNPRTAVAAGVGFATSNRESEAVGPGLSVRENLFYNPGVWGRAWWAWRGVRAERADAMRQIREFDVRPADPELALDTLSGGNQQKVVLARWFGVGRAVIVLEEPAMGVDVGAKADIYAILRDATREGTAAVVVSTDMAEVTAIAHRALVFGRGRVVDELAGADLTVANLVAAASDLDRRPRTIQGSPA
ncbi:MAG: sugar ABC transporter ATP-binding protein [Micrococcales bacterium]|nr:sugar ABC transporter ATP-binding protein [Micrococcales bacterium]